MAKQRKAKPSLGGGLRDSEGFIPKTRHGGGLISRSFWEVKGSYHWFLGET